MLRVLRDRQREHVSERPQQEIGLDRLRHVRVEARGDRPCPIARLGEGGEGHGGRGAALIGREGAQLLDEHIAVLGREADVAEEEEEAVPLEEAEEEDEELLEDASELGEDEDDMAEVIENVEEEER